MLENFPIIALILDQPFAIFKKQDLLYIHSIDDITFLRQWREMHFLSDKKPVIQASFYKDRLLLAAGFVRESEDFLLVVLFEKYQVLEWTDKQWQDQKTKLNACLNVLTASLDYTLERPDHSKKQKQKTASEIIIDDKNEQLQERIDGIQLESIFWHQFKYGDPISLDHLLHSLQTPPEHALSSDSLTDRKYRLVALITMLTRMATHYGTPSYEAYRLSDELILQMDQIKTGVELKKHSEHIVFQFRQLINKRAAKYDSDAVNRAIEFIYSHLYDAFANTDISEYVALHPVYLSKLFKQKTGVSLHQFIVEAKLNEAKYLLTNTNLPYEEISNMLHFSNQSHFGKLFKKYTHYTPKEFRSLY